MAEKDFIRYLDALVEAAKVVKVEDREVLERLK